MHTRPKGAHLPLLPQSSAKPLPTRKRGPSVSSAPVLNWRPQRPAIGRTFVLLTRRTLSGVSAPRAPKTKVDALIVRYQSQLTLKSNVCFAGLENAPPRCALSDEGYQQVGCSREVQVPLTVKKRSIPMFIHVAAVKSRKCLQTQKKPKTSAMCTSMASRRTRSNPGKCACISSAFSQQKKVKVGPSFKITDVMEGLIVIIHKVTQDSVPPSPPPSPLL